MFITLLLVTFVLALAVSALVARLFAQPLHSILTRIIDDPISEAWVRYMKFAILVVGVSAGVRIGELENTSRRGAGMKKPKSCRLPASAGCSKCIAPLSNRCKASRMLLVFFVVALMAYVVVRLGELKRRRADTQNQTLN